MQFEILVEKAPSINDTELDDLEARLNAMVSDMKEKCWANDVRTDGFTIYADTSLNGVDDLRENLKPLFIEFFDYIRLVEAREI